MSILDSNFTKPFKLGEEGIDSRLAAHREYGRDDEAIRQLCRSQAHKSYLCVKDDAELVLNRFRHMGAHEDTVAKYFAYGPVYNWSEEQIAELVYESYQLKLQSGLEENARRLLRQDFMVYVHALQVHDAVTGPRDMSFVRNGQTVYAIRPECEDMPVRTCIVDAVHADESYAELDDDYIGSITADLKDIFATESEAKTEAHARGLL